MLETAPINAAGEYSLIVGGSGGTTGAYTLQAILNAAFKEPTDSINTIGTAYDLSNAFASLGTAVSADRAGVIGTIDSLADVDYYKFWLNAGQSTTLAAAGLNGGVGLGLFDASGNLLALPSGASLSGAVDLGGGFSGATSQVTLNEPPISTGPTWICSTAASTKRAAPLPIRLSMWPASRRASISRYLRPRPSR